MVMNAGLDISPIHIAGGNTGILLLHGYTGAPPEVRPMAEYLGAKGMTVRAPLLPGHGTTPADLNPRHWRELAQAAGDALFDLQSRCETVFIGGLSMGALLTLHLGQSVSGIAGLIPMAPALYLRDPLHRLLPIARYLVESLPKSDDPNLSVEDERCAPLLWSYDRNPVRFAAQVVALMHHVRDRLEDLRLPMLVFHGQHDRTVPARAARVLVQSSRHPSTELVLLTRSGHCLSVDVEREQVFAKAWHWMQALAGSPGGSFPT